MIWIIEDLTFNFTDNQIIQTELYPSNYRIVVSNFNTNIFNFKNKSKLKQQRIFRTIYNYDRMNDEKWNKYRDNVESHID